MNLDLDFDTVLAAYRQHGTQKAAAKVLGTSQANVSTILRKGGLLQDKGSGQRKVQPEQVLETYQRLQNMYKAADELGITQAQVSYILRHKLGIAIGKGNNPHRKLPMGEIIRRYSEGENTVEIAKDFDVDPEIIRRRLNHKGVELRPRGLQGEKNHFWKGKENPYHERKYRTKKVYEELLGKQPLPGTVIHHMNENTDDNRPENLWLFPNLSCHSRYHQRLLSLQRQGLPADANQIALSNGAALLLRLHDPTAALPSIVPPNPFDKNG